MARLEPRKDLRNLAIIAHVDHGKTTLLDGLLRQTGSLPPRREHEDRIMDSQDLERERGITILAKSTAMEYAGVRLQLFDTPGHADFGGEVERVLGMADACLLLVDAVEGVMPQTRFVLRKALEHGLQPILVVNKIDRPDQRAHEVVDEVFDLLVELEATDRQLDFPVVYASAKEATATLDPEAPRVDLRPLLDTLIEKAPPPMVEAEGALQFQAVTLAHDAFLGRIVIGKVIRGELRRGETVLRLGAQGVRERFRITKLFGPHGIDRIEFSRARAGDIVMIAGIDSIEVGDTICDLETPEALPRLRIDPPTVRVLFSVNTSPFAGREGRYLTSRQIGARLEREALSNVSIEVERGSTSESFEVSGRGELQIAILMETLRREGYEFAVARPEIILRQIDGQRSEPVEDVVADVPEEYAGSVLEKLAGRRGRLEAMEQRPGHTRLRFVVPSRGLFGYRSEFLTDTRGEGVLHRTVRGYEPLAGELAGRAIGAIVASTSGRTTAHALHKIQDRADMFVGAGLEVYEGQIVGANRRVKDLVVNVCRPKKLTNVRASGRDEQAVLTPHSEITIESGLEWLADDELLEVTPAALRLRKRELEASHRRGR